MLTGFVAFPAAHRSKRSYTSRLEAEFSSDDEVIALSVVNNCNSEAAYFKMIVRTSSWIV